MFHTVQTAILTIGAIITSMLLLAFASRAFYTAIVDRQKMEVEQRRDIDRLDDASFNRYDGTEWGGVDVINEIKRLEGSGKRVYVKVVKKEQDEASVSPYVYREDLSTSVSSYTDKPVEDHYLRKFEIEGDKDSEYIEPDSTFISEVKRNSTGVIIGIVFHQQ